LTINGDVATRAHGLELVRQYPGIDGIMIGRGVFADPFCFAAATRPAQSSEQSAARDSDAEARSEAVSDDFGGENGTVNQSGESAYTRKQELIKLLNYHLDLYDCYAPQTNRPFETLKRFFKIYIRGFDGAKELRDQLMHTKSTDEVRALLETA
jgi:tRNA-dihydrouridine synthase